MKGFKLTNNGDISITDGMIDMVEGLDLETQTIKTVLSTNKGESPFNNDEGIDFRQIIGKHITDDQIRSQIQSGIHQVNNNRNVDEFYTNRDGRSLTVDFTARSDDGSAVTNKMAWG